MSGEEEGGHEDINFSTFSLLSSGFHGERMAYFTVGFGVGVVRLRMCIDRAAKHSER